MKSYVDPRLRLIEHADVDDFGRRRKKRALLRGGLKVIDLPGEQVARARQILHEAPKLSIHGGFAFALAESHAGCILLTGGAELRAIARRSKFMG